MSDIDADLDAGRARLQEVRDEVGFDPEAEGIDADLLWVYVGALEATVVGQHAAMKSISRTMRP